jgi:AAHS family 4-hydroxybenzoate transporter-like MFS transporter
MAVQWEPFCWRSATLRHFSVLVTNTAWAPILLRKAGLDGPQSSIAVAIFAAGSVAGTPLAGFLIGRFTVQSVLRASLASSAMAVGAVGYAGSAFLLVLAMQGFAGFCLGVASSTLIASAASFYSAAIRSTGIGWAMGLGRFGSFIGPLAVGLLVTLGWHVSFVALGTPALLAAMSAAVVGIDRPRSQPT